MIKGIGTDIIEVARIKKAIERTESFLKKVYTERELNYIKGKKDPYPSYGGRFAAKEAISKALGSGVRGFSLLDLEILNDELGKPYVNLSPELKKIYNGRLHLTISHTENYATATAIYEED